MKSRQKGGIKGKLPKLLAKMKSMEILALLRLKNMIPMHPLTQDPLTDE
jgi:hypothetical protein